MSKKSPLLKAFQILVRLVYRIDTDGLENIPSGGCLLLPNHITWVDAVLLQTVCPRPIRFLVFEPIYKNPFLNPIFQLLRAIPINSRKAKEAVQEAATLIRQGEIVCIFPEGELSRTGTLLKLRRGYELIANRAEAPVVPVWLDQLWGSVFSFHGGKYFKKLPKKLPYPVTLSFGPAISHDLADTGTVRERLLIQGEAAFAKRPYLKKHLAESCLRGLKHRQFSPFIIDGTDSSTMTRGTVLAAAITLSRELAKLSSSRRIAIILPPGRGAVIANLAVVLANRIPVNLNFTAGNAALESCIRTAELKDVISASALLNKFPNLPLPENVLLLDKILPPIKKQIALWRALVAITPWWILTRLLNIPKQGDGEEAVTLFTSGSSGDPKGVVLSHRNILGNASQFGQMLNLTPGQAILASLPFFHSFGSTVTLWFPMLEPLRIVTYTNPLDVEKNAELIHKHDVALFIGTPTFLRGYLRKATEEQLAPLKLVVTGAEKLPRDVADAFQAKFNKPVMEGYGLTETSPVVSVNLPDPPKYRPTDEVQPSARAGSVGKLAPGLAAQIRDPETGAPLSIHQSGMLWLKGPNIFAGYLNAPAKTAEIIQDGWLKTGDLGRIDEDGFLYIEGRISRFSKIGGEMVPHETMEAKIQAALESETDHERTLCIVGIPDEAKGEALILLTTKEIELPPLRSKLLAAGVPALWIPKIIKRVSAIPLLASGKLDLKACNDLARTPTTSQTAAT